MRLGELLSDADSGRVGGVGDAEDRVRQQLARWRDDLLDLTARNRLLRFRHTKTSSLEIDSPGAQEVLDRLLTGRSREWTVFIPEDQQPADNGP